MWWGSDVEILDRFELYVNTLEAGYSCGVGYFSGRCDIGISVPCGCTLWRMGGMGADALIIRDMERYTFMLGGGSFQLVPEI